MCFLHNASFNLIKNNIAYLLTFVNISLYYNMKVTNIIGEVQMFDAIAWLALVNWEHFDNEAHFHEDPDYRDWYNERRKLVHRVMGRGDFDMTIKEEQKLSDFYRILFHDALTHHKKTN